MIDRLNMLLSNENWIVIKCGEWPIKIKGGFLSEMHYTVSYPLAWVIIDFIDLKCFFWW